MHFLGSVLGVESQVLSSFPAQPPTEKSVLERWKSKVSSATYGDLRAALEQFSVFRGKNLLVRGRCHVQCKNSVECVGYPPSNVGH